jgi:hypothetical protein
VTAKPAPGATVRRGYVPGAGRIFAAAAGVVLFAFLAGFVVFASSITHYVAGAGAPADGIVVLTGGEHASSKRRASCRRAAANVC